MISKNVNYFKHTILKGKYSVKLIKLLRMLQHIGYHLRSKKIGNYGQVPHTLEEVGFFDKENLIHIKKEFEHLIDSRNRYTTGEFVHNKPGRISLVSIDGKIFLKKRFNRFKKYFKFYNELICLHRLREIESVPAIHYVDYADLSLYIDFVDGFCLNKNWPFSNSHLNTLKNREGFLNTIRKIHEKDILLYDIKEGNMILADDKYYIIDFADSIYSGKWIFLLTSKMKSEEEKKIKKKIFGHT